MDWRCSDYSAIKLKNGAYVISSILEITAIAKRKGEERSLKLNSFISEVSESAKLQDTTIELLFFSTPDVNQVQKARIRIILIIRKYGKNKEILKNEIISLQKTICGFLQSESFIVSFLFPYEKTLFELLENYENKIVVSLERRPLIKNFSEKLGEGWGFNSILLDQEFSFTSIFETLLQHIGTMISFVLMPTSFTASEALIIEDITQRVSLPLNDDKPMDGSGFLKTYYKSLFENISGKIFLASNMVLGETKSVFSVAETVRTSYEEAGVKAIFKRVPLTPVKSFSLSDFLCFPWNMFSLQMKNYGKEHDIDSALWRFPYIVTKEEAISFFVLPFDDGKIRGVNTNREELFRSQINARLINENNIAIGKVANSLDIGIPLQDFSRHALIVGMPGTGKTTFALNLLLQFYRKGIPFLAIEPTKTEYRALLDKIPNLQVFTPGKNEVVPFVMNPFHPPKEISIEIFKSGLFSAFKAAFSMPSPLDILFYRTLDECFVKFGWRSYSKLGDPGTEVFGLHEFIHMFKRIIEESAYSQESKDNMITGGVFRLMNLIVQGGSIYDTINSVPIDDLLRNPTVIELNAIENSEQKALLMALLLIQIVIYTKNRQVGDGRLKNIFLLDEAHVLLSHQTSTRGDGVPDSGSATVAALQNMIAEIRSYGTGIIISDQSPQKITKEIVGNTDLKVVFQLVQKEDRDMISNSIGLKNDQDRISSLKTGEAFVYSRTMDEPYKILTEDIRKKEDIRLSISDNEVVSQAEYWNEKKKLLIPYKECLSFSTCKSCSYRIREDAKYYASLYFDENKRKISGAESLITIIDLIDKWLGKKIENEDTDFERLKNCVRIAFLKKVEIDSNVLL